MSASLTVLLLFSCLAALVESEDVTTVFQFVAGKNGFENYGTWKVVSRNDARGFPVRRGNVGLSNVWAGQPCCDTWSSDGWTKLSDGQAMAQNPPLDPTPFESAHSTSPEKRSEDAVQYRQDSAGVWRGTMVHNSRARLHFRPPQSGQAALGIFLCGSEGEEENQCVAVIITGASDNGKTLRYQTAKYGSRETGTKRPSPNGILKTYVVRRDDRVLERWLGNNEYNFRIERSLRNLEVQLDDGDSSQRRQMTIPAGSTFSKLAVSLLEGTSDTYQELTVTEDPAWNGYLAPGASIKINFSPSASDTGHLGFALCEDHFREGCSAQVIDGISGGTLVRSDPAYWTAGSQEAEKLMPDYAKNATWGKPASTFTLTRALDGGVAITVDGDKMKYSWPVPAYHQYLIVDTYHNDGKANVISSESICPSVWRLDDLVAELRSPPIPESYVANKICVSVVAKVGAGAKLSVSVQRYQAINSKVLRVLNSTSPTWIKKRIVSGPSRHVRNYKVQIVLTGRQPYNTTSPLLVQWAAGCNPDAPDDEVTIEGFVPASTLQNQVGFKSSERVVDPTELPELYSKSKRHIVCENEGLLILKMNATCLCRPGFTGRLCEKGCGPNRFGENCESTCSNDFPQRNCSGMLLCTPDLPCDCAPGLMGARCDQPCPSGKYGVGCRQTCGKCSYDEPCDKTTGRCISGCEGARLPPFCREECGRKSQVFPLIGNGALVDQLQYPWHVGIFDMDFVFISEGTKVSSIEHICGGTLISPNIVVSAAHCFYDDRVRKLFPADRFGVALGKRKRGWNDTEEYPERTQKRNIVDIHVPIEFRGVYESKGEDDIAVLVLDRPVTELTYVLPACFDRTGGHEEELGRGSVGYVVGWGRMINNIPSEDLRQANLPYISRSECLKIVPQSFRPYVSARDRFCAGESGGSFVTRGDSGGGLVFLQNDVWFLRGVVSVRGEDKSVSAFTNVSYHRDWIVGLEQDVALERASFDAFLNFSG